jgi:alpha-L-rhamnosidase
MMGWDCPAADSLRNIEFGRLPEVSMIEAAEATWCVSFSGEFLGHVVVEVEAPEGSLLDIACDDWQAGHGGVALYQSNHFTDAADRFTLRGGRQRVELFHPRGGKLLQVTMRSPAGSAPLSLHDIFVRSRQTSGDDHTRFTSDNAILDWTWPVAMRTLIASTDEAFSDCPWRERGSYIGDAFVCVHLNLLLNRDYRSARRTLRLFAQAQLPDGQLACCAPSWLRVPHEDFTLIWLLALQDFCALTGDWTLAEELWPTVKNIWASPSWERHASGLWNTTGKRLFLDWGVPQSEREGEANAAINVLRFAAAKACAGLATVLGIPGEADSFLAETAAVESALMSLLWSDSEGRFRPSLRENSAAVHANTLALAFGLGDAETRSRMISYLEPKLRDNFAKGMSNGQHRGHLELYFLHYALPALADHGRPDLAEMLINQHYGFLRAIGDDTLPECFCRVEQAAGSRCHSWAGAPAIYAARYVLGIRPTTPGNPRKLIFNPVVHGITRASGRIAHPDGWIDVSWTLENGTIRPEIRAPQCVEVKNLGVAERLLVNMISPAVP